MNKRIVSNIAGFFSKRWEIWVSFVLIILFIFLGVKFIYPLFLRIALFIVVYWGCFKILSWSKWLLEKISPRGFKTLSLGLAFLFTGWIILIQVSILPDNINIKFQRIFTTTYSFSGSYSSELSDATINFIQEYKDVHLTDRQEDTDDSIIYLGDSVPPKPLDINIVGNIALVQVTAVPNPSRVFILIHPHNTEFWYVQTPLTYVDPYWEGYVYFGAMDCDCKIKFDLIVLGSKDWYVLDIFRGRGLRAGMKLDYLPILNQSEVIVVQKYYEEKIVGICVPEDKNAIEKKCPIE